MTRIVADVLVRGAFGSPIAIVEIKNREHLTQEVAIDLRHNMLAHGLPLSAPYLLILSQDVGFLWKQSSVGSDSHSQEDSGLYQAPPTLEFPMDKIVQRYMDSAEWGKRIRATSLELIVIQWLFDLSSLPQDASEEPEKSLASHGFIQALKGAEILAEAAA